MPSSADVESLQAAARPRGRLLDACLLGSVITLFAMVLAGAAGGFWGMQHLRADMARFPRAPEGLASALMDGRAGPPQPGSSYKAQNFAYLRAISSHIKNGVMEWEPFQYGNTSTVGSRFSYNPNQRSLMVTEEGTYFLYTKLSLKCTVPHATGSLRVTFHDNHDNEQMSCSLDLPEVSPSPVLKTCWTVIPHFSRHSRLLARMHINVVGQGWTLNHDQSGFGMFLVDGPEMD